MSKSAPYPNLEQTIGPKGYARGAAVATLAHTPLFDRASVVTNILVTNPSAADTWLVQISNKEIFRTPVDTAGNQHLLGNASGATISYPSIFKWAEERLGRSMAIPVPAGQTLTVNSVGGATANVAITYEEHMAGAVRGDELNGQYAKHFLVPVTGYLAASQAAAGEIPLDTRIASSWVPNFFIATSGFSGAVVPPGWRSRILALWLDPVGVNNRNGGADTLANTNYLKVIRNSQTMFSRDNTGIPALGSAAAAGSANSNFNAAFPVFPPFDKSMDTEVNILEVPLDANAGDAFTWSWGLAGTFTGGQSFAKSYVVALTEIWQV